MTALVCERMKRSFSVTVMLIPVSAALLMSLIVPYLADPGTVTMNGGNAAFIDNAGIWNGMDAISGLIYSIGDAACHQIPERSLFLNGNQMPICMRDVCILAGMSAGLVFCAAGERASSSKKMIFVAAALLLSLVADWIIQYATGSDSAVMRAVTGIAGGFGLAVLSGTAAYRMYDDAAGPQDGD